MPPSGKPRSKCPVCARPLTRRADADDDYETVLFEDQVAAGLPRGATLAYPTAAGLHALQRHFAREIEQREGVVAANELRTLHRLFMARQLASVADLADFFKNFRH